jgi:uncharacterized protein YcnI
MARISARLSTCRAARPSTREATRPRESRHGLARRAGIVAAASVLLFGLGAGVAFAHVSVNPNEVAAGSWAKLTFRVPNESATASTVSVKVSLPTDHPFPSVSLMPIPGWTATPHTVTLNPPVTEGKFTLNEATDSITWTAADGVGIKPGEFMEFSISVGPVPDVASLAMPAQQTYSDGSVVSWDQVTSAAHDDSAGHDGAAEPDHPAPMLTVTKTAVGDAHGAAAGASGASGTGGTATTDSTAQWLAASALILAAIALLVAVIGLRRRPQRGAAPSDAAVSDAAPDLVTSGVAPDAGSTAVTEAASSTERTS